MNRFSQNTEFLPVTGVLKLLFDMWNIYKWNHLDGGPSLSLYMQLVEETSVKIKHFPHLVVSVNHLHEEEQLGH